ncbi:hypothetical protein DL768_005516 [Monosporascus sp. mg162]|nr:hypothetical protein DL768_005516 [Monosporascus sp. mg162]
MTTAPQAITMRAPSTDSSKVVGASLPDVDVNLPWASSPPTRTHQTSTDPNPYNNTNCNVAFQNSSLHSLRHHATNISTSIPEECDEETNASESSPNEPLTPVSGRQSRDFHHLEHHDIQVPSHYHHRDCLSNASVISGNHDPQDDPLTGVFVKPQLSLDPFPPTTPVTPRPVVVHAPAVASPTATAKAPPVSATPPSHSGAIPATTSTTTATAGETTATPSQLLVPNITRQETNKSLISQSDQSTIDETDLPATPLAPSRSRQYSSSSLKSFRSFFSSYKRTNSNVSVAPTVSVTMAFKEPNYSGGASEISFPFISKAVPNGAPPRRRFSFQRSSTTTRSNTPPSPGSLAEKNGKDNGVSMPSPADFLSNGSKKNRAHTGMSLRGRAVNFVTHGTSKPQLQRTKSLERAKRQQKADERSGLRGLTREPWAAPAEAGVGMKARRLSLSLPDDFTVDVAELLKEFEYQHKLLGRHGRHLGKGATSKVTLMIRKGSPGELVAVKEFRHKSSNETKEEYENKIKSEYSIAKSLHHPNIVETLRLCTDHGRWNHVMEYCSEGDLFGLVSKKYLKEEGREVDRLCLFKQLCQGINYLHSNGIAHRDIKLENLLITKDSKLKITDFGVSEVFSGIHPGLREAGGQCGIGMGDVRLCKPGICGSLPYIAPEVISKKGEYDPRPLDVWSSAIVLIYLTFNACLWEKAEEGSSPSYDSLVSGWKKLEAKKVDDPESLRDAYPKVPAFEYAVKPASLKRLVLQMLHPDPAKRITIKEVISNRWMKGVECCQLESYEDPAKCIDASKKNCTRAATGSKIFCHNHLPPQATGHGLPPMPGKPGY